MGMNDPQILSTLPSPPAAPPLAPPPPAVFDTCQLGVVLRSVLLVEAVLAVAALYGATTALQALTRLAELSAGGLPAALLWLVLACALKRPLARLRPVGQYLAGAVLGSLAGLYAALLWQFNGQPLSGLAWLANACAGALLAGWRVAGLMLRAQGQAPAATAARLAELQARIRPHFLFNTLNSAIALVRLAPERAERLLEDLSDLFRQVLQAPEHSSSLADEVALAQRYLAIEQVRFGERLRLVWSLDPAAHGARLPPLLLQPLVENAVRHGVEPSAGGGEMRISTERRAGRVLIRVDNSLPDADPAAPATAGLGMAQDNVRRRLALLHDVQASFRATRRAGWYRVRIEVPV